MGWNYPGISLEEMVKLVKGFVDIMILASGYQSSSRLAYWDSSNIKKAFHWASFFQQVIGEMSSSDVYRNSVKELDAALREMTSHPSFPPGLVNLSRDTLLTARSFVLAHLLHTLPLKDAHLEAFLAAIIEMDLDKLAESEHDSLSLYLNKLTMQSVPLDLVQQRRGKPLDSRIASEEVTASIEVGDDELTKLTLRELTRRQSGATCVSTVETGLNFITNAIRLGSWAESDDSFCKEQLNHDDGHALMGKVEHCVNFVTLNQWKSRNISYFLNSRTVRLVSGASMIFSAPKVRWLQLFEQMNSSEDGDDTILHETMELLSLGCIANRWNCVIEYLISVSCNPITVSKLHDDVCKLVGGSQRFHCKEGEADSKENEILGYLTELVVGRPHSFWTLSPVLVAAAIPSWSPLFRLYFSELETQFKGDFSTQRCCSCLPGKEHKDYLLKGIWRISCQNLTAAVYSQVKLLREFGASIFFMFLVLVYLPVPIALDASG